MTYKEFIDQINPYENLYVVSRILDNKELIRGANFESVKNLCKGMTDDVLIFFY